MYDFFIKMYVERLTKKDIYNYALKQGINLSDSEINVIFDTIKNDWRTLYYGNARPILDKLQSSLSVEAYSKLEKLYMDAKEMIDK